MTVDATTMAEAIDWHLRLAGLDEDGWAAFTAWLEAPGHAVAYDRVAAADRLLDGAARPATLPLPANDAEPPAAPARAGGGARRWGWSVTGLAVAAGLAALALPLVRSPEARPYWLETRAGEHREVALADGTRVELNGATRLGLDRADPRVATLERGEAVFHVRHDAARPFAVRSGGLTVQDVGTVFDVTRDGARLDVAVAEGAVLFQPDADRIALAAGQALSAREDGGAVVRRAVLPADVGGWREGRLAFTGDTLGTVADAVRRRYGYDLVLAPGLSARGFTGMVAMSGSAARDIPHLAALVGAGWRRKGDQWILVGESGAR